VERAHAARFIVIMKTSPTILRSLILGFFILGIGSQTTLAATLTPRRLDGAYVPVGSENKWPVAVMIDNHTSARPQAGLQSASVVYETLAEGGIPRFMAIFADTNIKEVGPVRSTRPYFVRYAAEYNAALAHAGGSPDALNLLKKLRLQTFFAIKAPFAKYFYRAHIGGVHGLYTSGAKLFAALKQAGTVKLTPRYLGWQFQDPVAVAARPSGKHGGTIDLGYGKSYTIEYRFDRVRDRYLRYTGGRAVIDRNTKKQINVRNILILNVPKEKKLDRKGRLDINVIGKGTGVLLREGIVTKIVWKKKGDRERTRLYNSKTNEELVLTRGNTWIEVVPAGHTYRVY
jgi:hypothetical protein